MKYSHYSIFAIILHWLIAILIIGMLILGLSMVNMLDSPDKYKLYDLHKSTGIVILCLSLIRLFWRIICPAPPEPPTLAIWEKIISRITHWTFYFLIVIIPLSGWAMSSAGNHIINFYGWFQWPFFPGLTNLSKTNGEMLGNFFGQTHMLLGYMIIALLALHILAVLKHLFYDRDDIVYRMTLLFKPQEKGVKKKS